MVRSVVHLIKERERGCGGKVRPRPPCSLSVRITTTLAWKEGTFFENCLEERDPGPGPPSPSFGNICRLAAIIYDVRLWQLCNKLTWNIAGVVVVEVLVSHEQLDSS